MNIAANRRPTIDLRLMWTDDGMPKRYVRAIPAVKYSFSSFLFLPYRSNVTNRYVMLEEAETGQNA